VAAAKAFKFGFHANISHLAFENDLKVSDMWRQVCGKWTNYSFAWVIGNLNIG
jgi:hypothetical protein